MVHKPAAWLRAILLLLMLVSCHVHGPLETLSTEADRVATGIRAHYESRLDELPLSLQRHYAQRLYRITGDPRFLPYQLRHAEQLLATLYRDVQGLALQPGYALERDASMASRRPLRTERQRQRDALLTDHPGMTFATNLVFRLVQLDYYDLLDALPADDVELFKSWLAERAWSEFLLSEAAIRHYAAQAANQVWFLYQLGVTDLREAFIQRFREIYPDGQDAVLSRAEWLNKIYGMTHIVIAASRYYQESLPGHAFAWITDDFVRQLPALLESATEDVLAEVGISLALTGQSSHPAVEQIRRALISAYDPDARMIPSLSGSTDFARGEHRNVLAVMLLQWPDRLHPGPKLDHRVLEFYRAIDGQALRPDRINDISSSASEYLT
jgi:hypothetical protein